METTGFFNAGPSGGSGFRGLGSKGAMENRMETMRIIGTIISGLLQGLNFAKACVS